MRISDWSSDVCSSDLAADRRGADVAGMGKAGHLARHGAQAETGVGRIIGGLEPPVVEAEALGRAILQVKLAIVGLGKGVPGESLREIGVERVGAVEEAAGIGGACHRLEEHTAELQSLK